MYYDVEYHKALDRSHILPNFLEGARYGVISQFLSDILLVFLATDKSLLVNDIEISEIESYYAAIASGIAASVLSIFLDPFAVVLISTFTYQFVYDYSYSLIHDTKFETDSKEVITDSMAVILLIYAFDPTAHSQYERYWEKRVLYEPDIPRKDRPVWLSIFFIILVNTYNFVTD